MEYKASFDTLTKVLTLGVSTLFAVIALNNLKAIGNAHGDPMTVLIHGGIVVLIIGALTTCYLFSTSGYAVENNELIIKRPIGAVRVSISDITEIRLIGNGEMAGTLRTFGNGGVFGYYGKYFNQTFGSMTLYTTQRANRIYIAT